MTGAFLRVPRWPEHDDIRTFFAADFDAPGTELFVRDQVLSAAAIATELHRMNGRTTPRFGPTLARSCSDRQSELLTKHEVVLREGIQH